MVHKTTSARFDDHSSIPSPKNLKGSPRCPCFSIFCSGIGTSLQRLFYIQLMPLVSLAIAFSDCSRLPQIAGYPASLGFHVIHTLCIVKRCGGLVVEVSRTIETAHRRSYSNTAYFDNMMSREHARWHHFLQLGLCLLV